MGGNINMASQSNEQRLIQTSIGVETREQGTISGNLVLRQDHGTMQVCYEGSDEWLTVALTRYPSQPHSVLTTVDGFADFISQRDAENRGGKKR